MSSARTMPMRWCHFYRQNQAFCLESVLCLWVHSVSNVRCLTPICSVSPVELRKMSMARRRANTKRVRVYLVIKGNENETNSETHTQRETDWFRGSLLNFQLQSCLSVSSDSLLSDSFVRLRMVSHIVSLSMERRTYSRRYLHAE